MSDDRQRDRQPRELVGVIHVDGAIFRIDRTPSGHPGKKVLLEEYAHMRSLLGHDGAVARLCDAFSIDEITLRKSLNKYERQAAA